MTRWCERLDDLDDAGVSLRAFVDAEIERAGIDVHACAVRAEQFMKQIEALEKRLPQLERQIRTRRSTH